MRVAKASARRSVFRRNPWRRRGVRSTHCWVASPIHAAGLCRSRCSVVAPSGSTQGPYAGARAANAYSLGQQSHTFGGVLCVKEMPLAASSTLVRE